MNWARRQLAAVTRHTPRHVVLALVAASAGTGVALDYAARPAPWQVAVAELAAVTVVAAVVWARAARRERRARAAMSEPGGSVRASHPGDTR